MAPNRTLAFLFCSSLRRKRPIGRRSLAGDQWDVEASNGRRRRRRRRFYFYFEREVDDHRKRRRQLAEFPLPKLDVDVGVGIDAPPPSSFPKPTLVIGPSRLALQVECTFISFGFRRFPQREFGGIYFKVHCCPTSLLSNQLVGKKTHKHTQTKRMRKRDRVSFRFSIVPFFAILFCIKSSTNYVLVNEMPFLHVLHFHLKPHPTPPPPAPPAKKKFFLSFSICGCVCVFVFALLICFFVFVKKSDYTVEVVTWTPCVLFCRCRRMSSMDRPVRISATVLRNF